MSGQSIDTQFRARYEDTLKDGRYTVLRKLGESRQTTVWLVKDSLERPEKYAAAKILSVEATNDISSSREAEFLLEITTHYRQKKGEIKQGYYHLPRLFDSFNVYNESQKHLCLVMPVYTTSVGFLRRQSPTKSLPVYMVRKIVSMTLEALSTLHSFGIVHGDVNADDILFGDKRAYIDPPLATFLDTHEPDADEEGYLTKCQPLPSEWLYKTPPSEAERMHIGLVNFGHSEWMDEDNFRTKPSTDIWAVGQLTFSLLTGRRLMISPHGGPLLAAPYDGMEHSNLDYAPKHAIEAGMIRELQSSEEVTSPEQVIKSSLRSLQDVMADYKPGTDQRVIMDASSFIESCFDLGGKTPQQLLAHSFFDKAVETN